MKKKSNFRQVLEYVWGKTFGKLEGQYIRELRSIVGTDCQSLLDVGCGFNSPVQFLNPRPSLMIGVDGHRPAIEESRKRRMHDDYKVISLLEILNTFGPNSFDYVLASDVIEHLTKEDASVLIRQMECIARKKVIIYTPNGFLPQGEEYGNPFQRHLSGWSVSEMKSRGYEIIGTEGIRRLRGEMAVIRWKPRRIWLIISLLSQGITREIPTLSFRILCVKTKNMR